MIIHCTQGTEADDVHVEDNYTDGHLCLSISVCVCMFVSVCVWGVSACECISTCMRKV